MLRYMYIARLVKVVFETLEENNVATTNVKYTTEETRKAYGVAEIPTALLFIILGISWR